ncbi:MAG: gluconeogenesis factor YvcK family protein [bacterium]
MKYQPTKIVCFGGGTGLSTLLSGLKKNPWLDITAIVNMFDNGGSSGELRDRFGILPPGDVLKCLLALSEDEKAARSMLLKRIRNRGYSGHTGGNILLMGLEKVYGNYPDAIDAFAQLLSVQGYVVPVTLEKATLCARFADGQVSRGEVHVDIGVFEGKRVEHLYLEPEVKASPGALEAIDDARVICVGPGSFYTSLLPNFLPAGIREAIAESKAPIIYNANLLHEGARDGSIGAILEVLEKYLGRSVDRVIVNSRWPEKPAIQKYEEERKYLLVSNDSTDPRVVEAMLWIDDTIARHDPAKLAQLLSVVIEKVRR